MDQSFERIVELLEDISRKLDDVSSKLEGGQMMSVWDMLDRINDNLSGYAATPTGTHANSAWDKLDDISDKLEGGYDSISDKLDKLDRLDEIADRFAEAEDNARGAIVNFEPVGIITKSTSEMGPIRTAIAAVTSTTMIAYDERSGDLGTPDDKAALKKILEIDVPTYVRPIEKSFDLTSPVNLVVAAYKPERDFVNQLLLSVNRKVIRAWVKAPDVGFYPIEYGYQPGGNGRSKRGEFNPDFFLLLDGADEVVVVETKADDDVTDQNIGKLATAKSHFQKLNELLADQGTARRYSFHFLSPVDYDKFFAAALRKGKSRSFTSTLQAQLTP